MSLHTAVMFPAIDFDFRLSLGGGESQTLALVLKSNSKVGEKGGVA